MRVHFKRLAKSGKEIPHATSIGSGQVPAKQIRFLFVVRGSAESARSALAGLEAGVSPIDDVDAAPPADDTGVIKGLERAYRGLRRQIQEEAGVARYWTAMRDALRDGGPKPPLPSVALLH